MGQYHVNLSQTCELPVRSDELLEADYFKAEYMYHMYLSTLGWPFCLWGSKLQLYPWTGFEDAREENVNGLELKRPERDRGMQREGSREKGLYRESLPMVTDKELGIAARDLWEDCGVTPLAAHY